jgi:hypothetical protein
MPSCGAAWSLVPPASAAGLVVAGSVTHTLRSLLYGVQPIDPGVFLTGAGVLLGAVFIAASFPPTQDDSAAGEPRVV